VDEILDIEVLVAEVKLKLLGDCFVARLLDVEVLKVG
jgi:hypothetical protein